VILQWHRRRFRPRGYSLHGWGCVDVVASGFSLDGDLDAPGARAAAAWCAHDHGLGGRREHHLRGLEPAVLLGGRAARHGVTRPGLAGGCDGVVEGEGQRIRARVVAAIAVGIVACRCASAAGRHVLEGSEGCLGC